MRSKNVNHDGSGDGPESDFINRVLEQIKKELQFYDSQTITWEQTTRGTRAHVRNVRPGSTGTDGINPRGEWDPTDNYVKNDLVVISMGANQGTYLALQSVTVILPTTGAPNWLQLPGGLLGQWM